MLRSWGRGGEQPITMSYPSRSGRDQWEQQDEDEYWLYFGDCGGHTRLEPSKV